MLINKTATSFFSLGRMAASSSKCNTIEACSVRRRIS
jgi:hypothetical protein